MSDKIRVANGRGEMMVECGWEQEFPASIDAINSDVAAIFERNPHIDVIAIGYEGGCTLYSRWDDDA